MSGKNIPNGENDSESLENQNANDLDLDNVEIKDAKAVLANNKKLLAERKKLQEQLKDREALQEKIQALENERLSAEGKKDEVIKQLQAEVEKTKKANKSVFQNFAMKSLSAQVAAEATKQGCIDANALMKLADLSEIEVDAETFEADKEKITEIVQNMKTTTPYLFSKKGPQVNSSLPGNPESMRKKEKSPMEMTPDEIRKKLNSLPRG